MGENEKPLKNIILDILEKEWPLTAKQIYYTIKKNSSRHLTYQAVFKAVKEMEKKKMLASDKKSYKINIDWLFKMREGVERKIHNYILHEIKTPGDFEAPPEVRVRVLQFVNDIGPKAEKYMGETNGSIVIVSGGAESFGNGLYHYLIHHNKKVNKVIIDRFSRGILQSSLENRKIVVVDSATHTGRTYRAVMDMLKKVKKKYKIKDIKYAVYCDRAGVADWSSPNAYISSELDTQAL